MQDNDYKDRKEMLEERKQKKCVPLVPDTLTFSRSRSMCAAYAPPLGCRKNKDFEKFRP
jgi:hypothetical protein